MKATQTPQIKMASYIPNPEKPGFVKFDKYHSYKEVAEQIKATLKIICVDNSNAYDIAEWVSEYTETNEKLNAKGGMLAVIPRYGSNEGMIIDIVHINPNDEMNKFNPIITAKYFIDDKMLFDISLQLVNAIENGYYY
ncbi:hypothetical protein [Thalassotalea piscium]|uniref:Uncharacterized protein n=1 Tax=Thalassotalea piscium TaxID=1230533 RepID=A0A7X0TTH6_9GAMM|nr:hypothetical protein [Thalassotalea piscium]MBB6543134.1 hypothetical protein [Thalassotalea piscium]